MSECRWYEVGGIAFGIRLEAPWTAMNYTETVAERISGARRGDRVDISPVRAGDDIPARTFVRGRAELPGDFTRSTLDLSQYEPFHIEVPKSPSFVVSVLPSSGEDFGRMEISEADSLIMSVEEAPPYYYVYRKGEGTLFVFKDEADKVIARMYLSGDARSAEFRPAEKCGPYSVVFYLSMALRIVYSYNAAEHDALMLHSSVVGLDRDAVLFLGASGTGKSTHSRLWLENIPGAELVNDDNPVIRSEGGRFFVYGTPWSGKTPCYRKIRMPIRAVVRLSQAGRNEIARVSGLNAYAAFCGSISAVRWEKARMDEVVPLASSVVMGIPFYKMGCLPDADAARLCKETVFETESV